MTLPPDVWDALQDTAAMLQRKAERPNEWAIRTLANNGNTSAQSLVSIWDAEDGALLMPTELHDGSTIKSIDILAAVMGVDTFSAALYVLEKADAAYPDAELVEEAHWVVKNPKWGQTAALMFIPDAPERYAVEDGEDTNSLHCTLADYGDVETLGIGKHEFLQFAKSLGFYAPVAQINGQTIFVNDEQRICVLNVDSKHVEDARIATLAKSEQAGLRIMRDHGYSPHITLKYLQPDEPVPPAFTEPLEETFSRLRVSYGGDQWDITLPKAGTAIDPEQLEVKVVRRVRTAAGVRRYNQPIGSIIVADAVPNLPRAERSVLRPKRVSTASLSPIRGVTATYQTVPDHNDPDVGDGEALYKVTLGYAPRNRLGETEMQVVARPEYIADRVQALQEEYAARLPKYRVRASTPAKKYLDKSFFEPKTIGEALDRSESTRVVVAGSFDVTTGKELDPDVDTINTVNAVMGTYAKKYGSIHPIVGMAYVTNEELHTDYAAFNDFDSIDSPLGLPVKVARVGMHPTTFPSLVDGKHWQSGRLTMRQVMDHSANDAQMSYMSTDVDSAAKHLGVSRDQAVRMNYLHHEVGHSVSFIFLGKRMDADQYVDPDVLDRIREYRKQALDLVVQHGGFTQSNPDAHRNVSIYGTTNMAEHFAEIWASYMLDTRPSLYTYRIGALMDEAMNLYMNSLNERIAP